MKSEDRGPMTVRPQGSTVPIPVNPETDLSTLASRHLQTTATDLYSGDDIRFIGKSRLEAAIISLAEDSTLSPEARTEFLDRVMGKPKQRVDSTQVTVNLVDYLEQLRLAEKSSEGVIDAEFSPSDTTETEEGTALLC